jgi:thymidine phosphorylase
LGLQSHDEAIVLMREDCHICRSEGLSALSQVLLKAGDRETLATLYQVSKGFLSAHEAGLSEAAWRRLGLAEGDRIIVRHPEPVASLAKVRHRIFGHRLDEADLRAVLSDIVNGRYTDVHLTAFVTACAVLPLDREETTALTRAMIDVGERLTWAAPVVVDKHSVGGLPGNRTTPIVVAIVAALGLTIPKTSSRAITSPSGTADAMETLAPVDLDLAAIKRVVERESGCIVWGGSIRLSPADDIMIRIERALDIDTEGQLVASILSKKIAAGSTHLVLDLPIGPTAKVRSAAAAVALAEQMTSIATAFGLQTRVIVGDGTQPVGRGIGPALEALEVLAVLRGEAAAPQDLRDRACTLAGAILELAGHVVAGAGKSTAEAVLASGSAWAKFQRICEAQGGMRVPPVAAQRRPLTAGKAGTVTEVDNRKLSKLAKLAGAPESKAAGIAMHVRTGDIVRRGDPLCTVHAETVGELEYAFAYAGGQDDIFRIDDA